jgi:hypothetical protein
LGIALSGLDSEARERFGLPIEGKDPDHKILAAGVSGFGGDQEYLLLQRFWPKVKPAVVVRIFCAQNAITAQAKATFVTANHTLRPSQTGRWR